MPEVKSEKRVQRCVICGMPLSKFNSANVCFHHEEHPEYNVLGVPRSHKAPVGAGHDTPEIDRTEEDYSGGEIDWG